MESFMVYDSVCSFDLCGNWGQLWTFRRRKQSNSGNKWIKCGDKLKEEKEKRKGGWQSSYHIYPEYGNKIYSRQYWGWVTAVN